jgi:hypothetical protein
MVTTVSVIKTDTGGFVGHTEVHREMMKLARERCWGGRRRAPLASLCEAFADEGRFRSLYARRGRAPDLLVAAEEAFGNRAWVSTRDRLIDEGRLGAGHPSTRYASASATSCWCANPLGSSTRRDRGSAGSSATTAAWPIARCWCRSSPAGDSAAHRADEGPGCLGSFASAADRRSVA